MVDAESKYPATINVDTWAKQFIDTVLDETPFMYLGRQFGTQRDSLFIFAAALGWREGTPVNLEKPNSGSFIRTSSFSSQLAEMINLVRFASIQYSDANILREHTESYRLMERYANAGMHFLKSEYDSNKTSETFANELIEEMDEMYEKFFPVKEQYEYAGTTL